MPNSSLGSLTARPATRRLWRLPSTHLCLPSTLPGLMPGSKDTTFRSVQSKPCCTLLQLWIDLLQCPQNTRTCNLITLISKNSYSTAFATWCKLYRINELLIAYIFIQFETYSKYGRY